MELLEGMEQECHAETLLAPGAAHAEVVYPTCGGAGVVVVGAASASWPAVPGEEPEGGSKVAELRPIRSHQPSKVVGRVAFVSGGFFVGVVGGLVVLGWDEGADADVFGPDGLRWGRVQVYLHDLEGDIW